MLSHAVFSDWCIAKDFGDVIAKDFDAVLDHELNQGRCFLDGLGLENEQKDEKLNKSVILTGNIDWVR